MKTPLLSKTQLLLSALALFGAGVFAQAPIKDDDINGEPVFDKDALAAGDKAIFPPYKYKEANAMTVLENNPRFTVFVRLLKSTGMDKLVQDGKLVTVFAPLDAAFENMSEEEMAALTSEENREELKRLLAFHIAPSLLKSGMLTDPVTLDTKAEGFKVDVRTRSTDGEVYLVVGGLARVKAPDVEVDNGVIHAIDRVLFPSRNNAEES